MIVTDKQKSRLANIGCELKGIHDIKSKIFVSSALQWIRDNKEVACAVTLYLDNDGTFFYIGEYNIVDNRMFETAPFSTYPEAESQLLTELLTYLEKNK